MNMKPFSPPPIEPAHPSTTSSSSTSHAARRADDGKTGPLLAEIGVWSHGRTRVHRWLGEPGQASGIRLIVERNGSPMQCFDIRPRDLSALITAARGVLDDPQRVQRAPTPPASTETPTSPWPPIQRPSREGR